MSEQQERGASSEIGFKEEKKYYVRIFGETSMTFWKEWPLYKKIWAQMRTLPPNKNKMSMQKLDKSHFSFLFFIERITLGSKLGSWKARGKLKVPLKKMGAKKWEHNGRGKNDTKNRKNKKPRKK